MIGPTPERPRRIWTETRPLDLRLPECIELNHYRLLHDLPWDAIATMMRRRQVYVCPSVLAYSCGSGPLNARPRARTLYKIRRFVGHIRRLDKRRDTRKRQRARRRVARVPQGA